MKHLVLIFFSIFYHIHDRTSFAAIFFIIGAFLWGAQSFYILQFYENALKAGVYYERTHWTEIKIVTAVQQISS